MRAGLPQLLVDVRHEASHNELPSLSLLRVAAAEALAWLQASYWQRQADHLAACRAHISALLRVRGLTGAGLQQHRPCMLKSGSVCPGKIYIAMLSHLQSWCARTEVRRPAAGVGSKALHHRASAGGQQGSRGGGGAQW
jgi:hypothetical protein